MAHRNLAACRQQRTHWRGPQALPPVAELNPQDQVSWLGSRRLSLPADNSQRRIKRIVRYLKSMSTVPSRTRPVMASETRSRLVSESGGGGGAPDASSIFLGAIERFEKMSGAEVQRIAFEIALLGQRGLDVNDPAQKYHLKSLAGSFSGLHLVSLMYVGFKQIAPEQDIGFDLSREYAAAKSLHARRLRNSTMLIEVQAFCDRVERDLNGLIDELQVLRGATAIKNVILAASLERVSSSSRNLSLATSPVPPAPRAAGRSLTRVSAPGFFIVVRLLLLGRGERGPAAVLIELKHWDTAGDRPGPSERLIDHAGEPTLHPSNQVRSYTEYCRRFHSAVFDNSADLAGCMYFARAVSTHAYSAPPHDQLVAAFPIFTDAAVDTDERLPAFLAAASGRPTRISRTASNAAYTVRTATFASKWPSKSPIRQRARSCFSVSSGGALNFAG